MKRSFASSSSSKVVDEEDGSDQEDQDLGMIYIYVNMYYRHFKE